MHLPTIFRTWFCSNRVLIIITYIHTHIFIYNIYTPRSRCMGLIYCTAVAVYKIIKLLTKGHGCWDNALRSINNNNNKIYRLCYRLVYLTHKLKTY